MVCAIFKALEKEKPRNHFTIGIVDDVTYTHLDYDARLSTEPHNALSRALLWTRCRRDCWCQQKLSKIIGKETNNYAQGYFVYDSKKAGSVTISHLRFRGRIQSAPRSLINSANFMDLSISLASWSVTTCSRQQRPRDFPVEQSLWP